VTGRSDAASTAMPNGRPPKSSTSDDEAARLLAQDHTVRTSPSPTTFLDPTA
jgi:hypothetical protein